MGTCTGEKKPLPVGKCGVRRPAAPLFNSDKDKDLLSGMNNEMYQLYFQKIGVYKLKYLTETVDRFYHEDVNYDIETEPTYSVEGYVNVSDNGIAALYKQGQQIDRQLFAYFSKSRMEEVLTELNFDPYADVPTDGDVLYIQNTFWDIITVDPEGYHSNVRTTPFDYQCLVQPWRRDVKRPRHKKY